MCNNKSISRRFPMLSKVKKSILTVNNSSECEFCCMRKFPLTLESEGDTFHAHCVLSLAKFRWNLDFRAEINLSSACSSNYEDDWSCTLFGWGNVGHRSQVCGPLAALRRHSVSSCWLRRAAKIHWLFFEDRFLHRSMTSHSAQVHTIEGPGGRSRDLCLLEQKSGV